MEATQKNEAKVRAGREGARVRKERAEAKLAASEALERPDLSSPEAIRAYLELVMVSVVNGLIPARSGAAAASICSRLLKSHELSITKELRELRAAREEWERVTRGGTVTRRTR
jgi:hypothetical protein